MVNYDYKCKCGNSKEVSHSMNETPEIICPKCKQIMKKAYTNVNVSMSCPGFYASERSK